MPGELEQLEQPELGELVELVELAAVEETSSPAPFAFAVFPTIH